MKDIIKPLGIYLHIPFCIRKCAYCDFLSAPAAETVRERYVLSLCGEIRACARTHRFGTGAPGEGRGGIAFDPGEYEVRSIFLGGGTPSILTGEQIGRILRAVRETFPRIREDAEITAECNPGTLSPALLAQMKEAGINRLSIGAQSADNAQLACLGRIHTWEMFEENYRAAREAGFTNINVDLMSGLPGQSLQSWEDSLLKVLALQPEHISAYSLIIEEGTPFYERYHEQDERRQRGEAIISVRENTSEETGTGGVRPVEETADGRGGALPGEKTADGRGEALAGKNALLPDEETERAMYDAAGRILSEAGFARYEISNYARPGYESIHNTGYWVRTPYAGFGLGASSLLDGYRIKNTADLERYLGEGAEPEEILRLDRKDEMEETMFLGLRMMRGVDTDAFEKEFHIRPEKLYEEQIKTLAGQGLIAVENGFIRLTGQGIDISNYVMAQFLLD